MRGYYEKNKEYLLKVKCYYPKNDEFYFYAARKEITVAPTDCALNSNISISMLCNATQTV